MSARGLSILETVVIIGLLAFLAALGLPVAHDFTLRQDLPAARRDIVHVLRRAQLRAVLDEAAENIGVRFVSGTGTAYTLFRGSSWESRNPDVDEEYRLPSGIGMTFALPDNPAQVDILFSRGRGQPNISGTMYVSSGIASTTVNIGSEGQIRSP